MDLMEYYFRARLSLANKKRPPIPNCCALLDQSKRPELLLPKASSALSGYTSKRLLAPIVNVITSVGL